MVRKWGKWLLKIWPQRKPQHFPLKFVLFVRKPIAKSCVSRFHLVFTPCVFDVACDCKQFHPQYRLFLSSVLRLSVLWDQPNCKELHTSAWPPGFNVLLQRSHFRQNLCQSFPKDDTFSAAEEEETEIEGFTSVCREMTPLKWVKASR